MVSIIVLALLFCSLPQVLFAQAGTRSSYEAPCDTIQRIIVKDTVKPSQVRFGASVGYVLPFVNAQFSGLPGVSSCCSQYSPLSASGFGVGVLGEIPLLPSLGIGARLGLTSFSMSFSQRKIMPVANPADIANPLSVPLLYSLSTSFSALSLEPYIFYRPIQMLSIHAGFGFTTLLSGTYNQSERLDTAGLNLGAIRAERNVLSGTMPNLTSILPSVHVGANYEIPLGERGQWLVAPEASFSLSLGNLVSGLQGTNPVWTMSSVRGGVSVRYSPERTTQLSAEELAAMQATEDIRYRKKREECEQSMPPPIAEAKKKNVVTAKITSVSSIQADGSALNTSATTIHVEEFLASRSRYVLNNIFFDSSSSEIAARYERLAEKESAAFRLESFAEAGVLQIYYHVLNIVGKRLSQNPKADITLVGHADGLTEKNDKRLAQARAEKIKEYLVTTWKIPENRIKIQTGVSRTPTGTDGDEILEAEEQRRVEIQSTSRAILEELRFDYFVRVIEPPKIRFQFDISSTAALKEWLLVGKQRETRNGAAASERVREKVLFEKRGKTLPTLPEEKSFEWEIAKSANPPQYHEPVMVRLAASDATSDVLADSASISIPVNILSVADKEKIGSADKRTDSYTLFSFAYGTNAPITGNADVQRVVAAIKQTLKPGALVTVSGYTDTRGNEITNGILAQQRANAVAGLIAYPNMVINSFGATKINDNALPEGRFYNRFVQVDVQTPLR